jgi:hypothetical protein
MRKLVLLWFLTVLTLQLSMVNIGTGAPSSSHLVCKKVPAPNWWWADATVAETEEEEQVQEKDCLPRAVASQYLCAFTYYWQTALCNVHAAEPVPADGVLPLPACSASLLQQHRGLLI